jgi:hypothetical protein
MCTLYWFKKIIYFIIILIILNIVIYIILWIYICYITHKDYYTDIYAEEKAQLDQIQIIDDAYQFPPWDEMLASMQADNS